MNTAKTWQTVSSSSADTSALGEQFGRACRGGEVLLFISDLGGGKTTMVKGLARGLGSHDQAASPSFALSKVYDCRDGIKLYHFDFYRLPDAGLMSYELAEYIDDPKAVIAVEWGDVVKDVLPPRHIVIVISRLAENEESRHIKITYPPEAAYILEGVL